MCVSIDRGITVSFWDRLQRKRELQASAGHTDGIEAALELNAIALEDIAAIRDMAHTDGWQMLAHEFRKDLAKHQKAIENMAIAPDDNRYKLAYHGATCALIRRVLDFVDGTMKHEPNLVSERNRLRDAAITNHIEGA